MHRTLLLARTFFGRFFESDLMPPGLPQVQLVIWSMAFLAMPGLLLPARFAAIILSAPPNAVGMPRLLLLHHLLFVTLSMTAIGLVALVVWGGMFPDRRDARILGGLPVPGRELIAGRMLALAALCSIFVVGPNAMPTLLNGPLLPIMGGASNPFRGMAAHFLATTMAGVFVFSSLLMLQAIALNVGGRKAADRLSFVLQLLFVATLLQMLFFLPRMVGMLGGVHSGWLRMLPSVWFVGLYEVIGGRPPSGSGPLAAAAVIATLGTVGVSVVLLIATHGRLTRLALESPEMSKRSKLALRVVGAVTRTLCRHPAARATFEFTLQTLARSKNHRLLMALYGGVAIAFVASGIVPLAIGRGFAGFLKPGIEVLSAPFVISFFLLIGARVAVAIPVEPKANWVVRLREPANRRAAIDGVRAALLVVGVAPAAIVAAATAATLWGPRAAFVHTFVCLLMGWLLAEILLANMFKFPFTCTYSPGRSRIGMLWPVYLTAFSMYAYTTARFEQFLLGARTYRPLAIFSGIIVSVIAALTWRRYRRLAALSGFRYRGGTARHHLRRLQPERGICGGLEGVEAAQIVSFQLPASSWVLGFLGSGDQAMVATTAHTESATTNPASASAR